MNRVIQKSIFFLIFFTIVKSNVYASGCSPVVREMIDQFNSLIEFNRENTRNGKSENNHYIFVYTPGEPYSPVIPPSYQYIFEQPPGTTPEGQFLDGVLNTYNNSNIKNYQHYVIVVNLTYAVQSKIKSIDPTERTVPAWYKSFYEDLTIYDHGYYTTQINEMITEFKAHFDFSVFDSGYEKLITFFIVTHDHSLKKDENILINKRVQLRYFQSSNNSPEFKKLGEKFVIYNRDNGSSNSLQIIYSTISNYIKYFFEGNLPPTTTCQQLAATILFNDAREFFTDRCTQAVLENPNKLNALKTSAYYVEYLENIFETVYESDPNEFDFEGTVSYIGVILSQYLNNTDGSTEYKLHLREQYENYWIESNMNIFRANYFQIFYNVEQPSVNAIVEQVKIHIKTIKDNFSRLNALQSVFSPIGLPLQPFDAPYHRIESSWDKLSENFKYASTGAYTETELISLLGQIKDIPDFKEVVFDKWLVGDGGGNFWDLSDLRSGAKYLSDFIVLANQNQLSGCQTVFIPMKLDPNFTFDSDIQSIASIAEYTVDGNFKFDYTINLCKRFYTQEITLNMDREGRPNYQTFKITSCAQQELLDFNDVGFFDQIYLMTMRNHPSLVECGYETEFSEDIQNVHPVAGFYLAFAKERDCLDDVYQAGSITLQLAATAFTGAGIFAAVPWYWRLIAGFYTALNVTSFYTGDYPTLEADLKKCMANDEEATEWAQFIHTAVNVGMMSELIVNPSVAGNLLDKVNILNYKRAVAFSEWLDDAAEYLTTDQVARYSQSKLFGQAVAHTIYIRNGENVFQNVDNIYQGIYGINDAIILDPVRGVGIRNLVNKCRVGSGNYQDIHEALNDLTHTQIEKFADDLELSPSLVDYFGTGGPSIIDSKLEAWKKLLHADIPNSIRRNTDYIDAVKQVTDNYGTQVDYKFYRTVPFYPDKPIFFDALKHPKSLDHVRSLVGDIEDIPGITMLPYGNGNGLEDIIEAAPSEWNNSELYLEGWKRATFTSLDHDILPPGTEIWRIVGSTELNSGTFWLVSLPSSRANFYSLSAVRPEFNGATQYIKYTVGAQGLKVWKGPCAMQPVLEGVNEAHFIGSAQQYVIPRMDLQGVLDEINNLERFDLPW